MNAQVARRLYIFREKKKNSKTLEKLSGKRGYFCFMTVGKDLRKRVRPKYFKSDRFVHAVLLTWKQLLRLWLRNSEKYSKILKFEKHNF